MDKSALKRVAVAARRRLREQIARKAQTLLGGAAEGAPAEAGPAAGARSKLHARLLRDVRQQGLDAIVEQAAQTWFNRFIALRYMEANGCPGTEVRLFAGIDPGAGEERYRELLLARCRTFGETLPFLFPQEEDAWELLLPDELLGPDSVLRALAEQIAEEDWTEGVEIIGWLHQHYMSERKDEAFAGLQRNEKLSKELIPAATQLFTPAWIVKYMVENSLGRLWLESHPDGRLQRKWTCLVEPLPQEAETLAVLEQGRLRVESPEQIRVLDPACGSGHILVYAFDLLCEIYADAGYPDKEIPGLILRKNLFGLDIDDHAVQLARFSLLMKAQRKNPDILREKPELNVAAFQEPEPASEDAGGIATAEVFRHAKLLGSLIEWAGTDAALPEGPDDWVRPARMLANTYHVIVTNPPYMGRKGMNRQLADYVSSHYPLSQSDLFAVFLEKTTRMLVEGGYNAAVTQQSWMFLSSYEALRRWLLRETTVESMLHLGPRAFDEIGGEVVQSTAFVLRKLANPRYAAIYYRLTDLPSSQAKEEAFLRSQPERVFAARQEAFASLPGSPIAYWATPQVRRLFGAYPTIGDAFAVKKGMDTGNNEAFLRYWYEVDARKLGRKWVPYQKGGEFRRWYGNQYYVVDWEEDGREIRRYPKSNLRNERYYFQPGITWSTVSTAKISFRKFAAGSLFDNGGSCLFEHAEQHDSMLAFLNSKVTQHLLYQINPTFNYQPGDVAKLPLHPAVPGHPQLARCGAENAGLAKRDWDAQELSRQFDRHPLLRFREAGLAEEAWQRWSAQREADIARLRANEEEANRLLIGLYGLAGELSPDVGEEELAVRKDTVEACIRSFVSYAVGCMFGRYSLDRDGLVCAGGALDPSAYVSFSPAEDGIVPIGCSSGGDSDDDSAGGSAGCAEAEDAAGRFIRFVGAAFGDARRSENLRFIAAALGKRGHETDEQRIRTYFRDHFYPDHVKAYRKRPIYWLFCSGKEKAFQALVYLHRYDADVTIARLCGIYVPAQIRRTQAELRRTGVSAARSDKLRRQLEELGAYLARLRRYAACPPRLELDDGIKANYIKLSELLAPLR